MYISGYRAVWIFVAFDLPVLTKKQRREARLFRKALLEDGFWMLQYSLYARPCPSEENSAVHTERIRSLLPPDGEVRILQITDKQWGRMEVYLGKVPSELEQMPRQLELF